MNDISRNIETVLQKIKEYESAAGVQNGTVDLIAVSKTVDAIQIAQAYDAGLKMFGENRVQEYLKKSEVLAKDIKWNLIGQLQTNKVKYIINKGVFLLHSLDRVSLADALQDQCQKQGGIIDTLVQLNLSKEDTKSGLFEEDLDRFLDVLDKKDRVRVRGIMTIGPNTEEETAIRTVFAKAKNIFDRLQSQMKGIDYLSTGMSHDFGWAILEGSNLVRVGTAVFGKREYLNC